MPGDLERHGLEEISGNEVDTMLDEIQKLRDVATGKPSPGTP